MQKRQQKNKSHGIYAKALLVAATLGISSLSYSAEVIWSEEFNSGNQPDPSIWSYDLGGGGWGNSELQSYTNDTANVSIANGYLAITALEQSIKGGRKSYTSARVKSENKLTFQYGTIEARIKVSQVGDGLWPAFWTLGNNISQVGWPDCGELDIMEMGSAQSISDGSVNRLVSSTAHWEHNGGHASYGLSYDYGVDLHNDFHVYRMEWTPSQVSTYIDNHLIWTIDISSGACTDCSEFHQPHFIILNLAVGGLYTGITRSTNITAPMPAQMLVDYVRISDNGYTILGGTSQNSGNTGVSAHIESIVTGISGGGPNKVAKAEVKVVNELGEPVSNAEVTGTFSGSHNQTLTVLTDATGVADFATTVKSNQAAFSFCVDSLTHASLSYDAAANLETCDSY